MTKTMPGRLGFPPRGLNATLRASSKAREFGATGTATLAWRRRKLRRAWRRAPRWGSSSAPSLFSSVQSRSPLQADAQGASVAACLGSGGGRDKFYLFPMGSPTEYVPLVSLPPWSRDSSIAGVWGGEGVQPLGSRKLMVSW